jgi:hypothetical protein
MRTLQLVKRPRISGSKFADETRFYQATILKDPSKANASKGWPQEKTTNNEFMWVGPPDLVRMPGSRQRFAPTEGVKDAKILQTAPFANASIGAHQINGFFIKKNSVKKYFADDVFLLYMLQIYSDVKVYTDGTHAKYSPRQPDIIKYGSRSNPKSDAPLKQIIPFGVTTTDTQVCHGEVPYLIKMNMINMIIILKVVCCLCFLEEIGTIPPKNMPQMYKKTLKII